MLNHITGLSEYFFLSEHFKLRHMENIVVMMENTLLVFIFFTQAYFSFMKGKYIDVLKYLRAIKMGKAKVYLYYSHSWHNKLTDEF